MIRGQVFWGGLLVGDGPFTGTIASNGSATFAENLSNGTITFKGTLASDGSFGGTYLTTLSAGGRPNEAPGRPGRISLPPIRTWLSLITGRGRISTII